MPDQAGDARRAAILAQARDEGSVTVADLAATLGASTETIRRDLRALADAGLLRRTHGGARPVEGAGFETALARRATSMLPEKRRIAQAMLEELGNAESLYIDEGFTPDLVARGLGGISRPLAVVTSSLSAAQHVAEFSQHTVYILGGRVRSRTQASVDEWALRMLQEFTLDVAVLGANGVSQERGLTTPDPVVAAVKRAAVAASRRRVFVGVHTKFGVRSFAHFADVDDFELFITDTGLSAAEAHRLAALGPRVLRV
ncbi:MAG TPA: DeoR/GlpR family DNA-binding transcription regulator [Actinotalea caeni]|uniref:DeoR/GlpR family DNA-binding transcription regulator n=1 Tax=Actinotalea caeni TaxID=1348467 RepID=UPI0012E310BB|nr:DeoR/GlpR family DNA-binding transcription regulator [Actinotalea caeni]HLV54129.1 DeoR/GlpR family DNA-binding transcription regulator [Actinotalea caeni]